MPNQMEYHLVFEYLPGDFMPVDIATLLYTKDEKYNTLEKIDEFTKQHTIEEIKEMVKDLNLVPDIYLNGDLKIINNRKYRYRVISKDDNLSLDIFFAKNISNKRLMNKFLNIYLKYNKEKDSMQKALNEENVYEVLNIIFSMPYEIVRNIYTYVIENF